MRPVKRVDAARPLDTHVKRRHGSPRRSPALRVFDDLSLPESWEILPGVPHTRGDCPTTRPCPHVKCRYHLWLVESDSMPGRRHEKGAPPASDLHPWSNTTCALDIAERVGFANTVDGAHCSVEDVARMLGMSSREVRRIVERARKKMAGNPDAADVLRKMVER